VTEPGPRIQLSAADADADADELTELLQFIDGQ
jgi:hypothetical protein